MSDSAADKPPGRVRWRYVILILTVLLIFASEVRREMGKPRLFREPGSQWVMPIDEDAARWLSENMDETSNRVDAISVPEEGSEERKAWDAAFTIYREAYVESLVSLLTPDELRRWHIVESWPLVKLTDYNVDEIVRATKEQSQSFASAPHTVQEMFAKLCLKVVEDQKAEGDIVSSGIYLDDVESVVRTWIQAEKSGK